MKNLKVFFSTFKSYCSEFVLANQKIWVTLCVHNIYAFGMGKSCTFFLWNQESFLLLYCLPQIHTIHAASFGADVAADKSWAIKQTFTNAFLILFLSVHIFTFRIHPPFTAHDFPITFSPHTRFRLSSFFQTKYCDWVYFLWRVNKYVKYGNSSTFHPRILSNPVNIYIYVCVLILNAQILFGEKFGSSEFIQLYNLQNTHILHIIPIWKVKFNSITFILFPIEICLNIQIFLN